MNKRLNHDATLLIKLPSELKGAFKGLCDSKGVTMTEELRRFMSDEVIKSTNGMSTANRQSKAPKQALKADINPTRCKHTPDMFDTSDKANKAQSAINAKSKRRVNKKR